MAKCHIVLLILNFICVCLAIAGNVASLIGSSWWKSKDGKKEYGLWRTCVKDAQSTPVCLQKNNIFNFSSGYVLDYAIVLVLLAASSGCLFIALIPTLSMFCCTRSRGCWTCGAIGSSIFTFIGAVAGLAALIYAEIEFKDTEFNDYDRGWSNMVGWVGSGVAVIACIFSLSMICKRPEGYTGGNVVVNPVSHNKSTNVQMVNRGYQYGF